MEDFSQFSDSEQVSFLLRGRAGRGLFWRRRFSISASSPVTHRQDDLKSHVCLVGYPGMWPLGTDAEFPEKRDFGMLPFGQSDRLRNFNLATGLLNDMAPSQPSDCPKYLLMA